jgi:hypothetical protein
VTNVSEVTLAHFDNTTQRWNSHGGSGIGTPANGSVTWNGVNMNNSYGYFTLGNLNACNAPWGTIATNITTNSATLSWTAVSGAMSYDVDYSNSSVWINAATATTNTSINLSGLNSGSYYQWRIRTNCSSTSSLYRQAAFNTICETPVKNKITYQIDKKLVGRYEVKDDPKMYLEIKPNGEIEFSLNYLEGYKLYTSKDLYATFFYFLSEYFYIVTNSKIYVYDAKFNLIQEIAHPDNLIGIGGGDSNSKREFNSINLVLLENDKIIMEAKELVKVEKESN